MDKEHPFDFGVGNGFAGQGPVFLLGDAQLRLKQIPVII